ncbi:unnamed protein product [Acanthoscelides obtectus]|uniref:Uncharacterized protein n=1 Tax=Acanthoscelides obtectus TaxID=200917 RepID=A0A9P0QIZ5_ACAOB|nr:unnamed protein product [Acanthoscelides obtectus]CAK1685486.1 hypothetical protein AOBTE_LOCUS35448 [Acanthoscelides obtectus]
MSDSEFSLNPRELVEVAKVASQKLLSAKYVFLYNIREKSNFIKNYILLPVNRDKCQNLFLSQKRYYYY